MTVPKAEWIITGRGLSIEEDFVGPNPSVLKEGWICPVCKKGVSPSLYRCPCADDSLRRRVAMPKPVKDIVLHG